METSSLLLLLVAVLAALAVILLVVLLLRRPEGRLAEQLERALRDEQRDGRAELRQQLDSVSSAQAQRIDAFGQQLQALASGMDKRLDEFTLRTDQRLDVLREALTEDARKARTEGAQAQQRGAEALGQRMQELRGQLDAFGQAQEVRIQAFGQQLGELIVRTDGHMAALREALVEDTRKGRQESADSQQRLSDSLGQRLAELTQRNEQRIGEMRATLEARLKDMQTDNAGKLEQMRATVDEKLQATLNTRLDASFKLVSERLEQVQRGLGEMQQLATGVGDLKRVLTNVKDRGGWGEVQLESILEQTLTLEQYSKGVRVRPGSAEAVDFAIRLPGRSDSDAQVWLPIDAKFPREDYERLLDAQEKGDVEAVRGSGVQLERAIRIQAKSINEKYVVPPHTTDFAVMFLPTEGLYAETIRRPGLTDALQREHRVILAGPTTFSALLNSLQMGFRTLAIEQRSSEVWQLLGAVKTEFGKFATVLEKAHGQLDTVQNSIKQAGVRTRAIERQLKGVESLPVAQAQTLLEQGSDEAE